MGVLHLLFTIILARIVCPGGGYGGGVGGVNAPGHGGTFTQLYNLPSYPAAIFNRGGTGGFGTGHAFPVGSSGTRGGRVILGAMRPIRVLASSVLAVVAGAVLGVRWGSFISSVRTGQAQAGVVRLARRRVFMLRQIFQV